MIYPIDRPIRRFAVIRPGMPLHQWLARQQDKPDILFNASLYKSVRQGIGTFYENGRLTQNAGSGWGFGSLQGRPGEVAFGTPFDGTAWQDYLTGYYGLIRQGKKADPPWSDRYVFEKKHRRIAFGRLADGRLCVVTHPGADIASFRDYAWNEGCRELCNLDGGGSVSLFWLGRQAEQSGRTPYNAVAIWLEPEEPSETEPEKEEAILQVRCTKKTAVYTAEGKLEPGRYIDAGDLCQLETRLTPALLLPITYPAGKTQRRAYIRDLANFCRA